MNMTEQESWLDKKRARTKRPCAICQSSPVGTKEIPGYFCKKCQEEWKDAMNSDWVRFCVEESDETDKMLRSKSKFEVSLEQTNKA